MAWLSGKKAMAYLDIRDRRTLRKLLGSGLPHSRVGGMLRIHTDDIDAFMAAHRPGPSGQVQREVDKVLARAGLGQ